MEQATYKNKVTKEDVIKALDAAKIDFNDVYDDGYIDLSDISRKSINKAIKSLNKAGINAYFDDYGNGVLVPDLTESLNEGDKFKSVMSSDFMSNKLGREFLKKHPTRQELAQELCNVYYGGGDINEVPWSIASQCYDSAIELLDNDESLNEAEDYLVVPGDLAVAKDVMASEGM